MQELVTYSARLRRLMLCLTVTGLVAMAVSCTKNPDSSTSSDPTDIARRVVAEFLSLSLSDVNIVSSEAKEFSDSSLDCPEAGMAYAQVITPGHRVIAEADGRRFDVRVAGAYGRICRNNKPGKPGMNSGRKSAVTSMIERSRKDLARQLGINADLIRPVTAQSLAEQERIENCTPKCGRPGCAYHIVLDTQGRRYSYHATDLDIAPCPAISRM